MKTNMPKKTKVTDIIGQPIKFHVFAFEPNLGQKGLKGKNIAVGWHHDYTSILFVNFNQKLFKLVRSIYIWYSRVQIS